MMFEYELVYNSERFYTILILLLAIIFTSIISTYAQFRVRNREQRIGALLLNAIVLIYQMGQFLAVISPPRELAFFVSLQCIGFCMLGPAFYIYICTLLKTKPIGLLKTAAISSLCCAGIVLVLTNSFHGMFYTIYNIFYIRYGVLYILILILNSLYALSGCILLIKYMAAQKKHNPGTKSLIPASLLMVVGACVFDGINPDFLSYDIAPSCISIIQLLFLYSNRLSGLSGNLPIGRSNILDCINESVLMTDVEGNVIYHNDTPFNRQISMENGVDIQCVLTQLINMYKNPDGLNTLNEQTNLYKVYGNANKDSSDNIVPGISLGEFSLVDTITSYYSYSIQPIRKGALHVAGTLYIFRDITEDKRLLNHLDARNSELAATYERLKKYSVMVKQLSVEKERNRILKKVSRDVEEAVLQIITLLEGIKPIDDSTARKTMHNVQESIKVARSGIAGIRKSVSTISASLMQEGEKMDDSSYYS